MKLIIIGPQCSGKGTQSKLLSDHFKIPHISTGDILRKEYKNKTELGLKAYEFTNKGLLIPNEIINNVIKECLQKKDCKKGFILDGYPRNITQAEFLNSITNIDKMIYLKVTQKLIFKRLKERVICPECNYIYGLNQKPKKQNICDYCGSKLVKRHDDTMEKIKERLKSYNRKTKPLLKIYKDKLIKIDGSKEPDKIFKEINEKLQ